MLTLFITANRQNVFDSSFFRLIYHCKYRLKIFGRKTRATPNGSGWLLQQSDLCLLINYTINGASTNATIEISFSRMFNEGPEVSLNGSPTVSPTTAALCGSDFL